MQKFFFSPLEATSPLAWLRPPRGGLLLTGLAIFLSFVLLPAVLAAEQDTAPQDLFRFDDVVEISAPVGGDLYAVGLEVILRGPVAGDILAAGRKIVVQGEVQGDVRIIGEDVRIESAVAGNVSVAAQVFTLASGARVGKNITVLAQWADLGGTVAGDAQLRMAAPADFRIQKDASLNGKVVLYSPVAPVVEDGALLRNPIERQVPETAGFSFSNFIFSRIIALFSLSLIGLIAIHLVSRPSLLVVSCMYQKPLRAMLWGVPVVFVTPFLALLIALTVIGIPIALMIGALWATALYSARIFTAIMLAFAILSRIDRARRIQSLVVALLLGMLLLTALESIPIIGFPVTIVATLWGLGGMVLALWMLATHKQPNNLKPTTPKENPGFPTGQV